MDENQVLSHLSGLFPNKSQAYLRRQYRRCNYNLPKTIEKIEKRIRDKEENVLSNFFSSVINGFKALFCNCSELYSTSSTTNLAESIDTDEAQVANNLIREDEAFARRLQEEEEVRSAQPRRVDAHCSTINEWPEVHRPKAGSSAAKQSRTSVLRAQDEEYIDDHDENDLAASTLEHPAILYRQEAQRHVKKRAQFYKQAKQCLRTNDKQRAHYYFNQAKKETKLIEENNNRAATAFLAENANGRKETIDLHHLYVREAIEALDNFLDDEILDLEDQNCHKKDVNVITGRGKHSQDGIPKVKPAVINRLRKRNLRYLEINPGCLKVFIFHDSFLTNELI